MGIKAESLMGSKEGIKVGHTGQRYVLSSQKSSCFHPTLSHLCRSTLLLQLPWAHTPTVSAAACPLGLRLSICSQIPHLLSSSNTKFTEMVEL